MAFKPIRADDSVTYVSIEDPAIDWPATIEKHEAANPGDLEKVRVGLRGSGTTQLAMQMIVLGKLDKDKGGRSISEMMGMLVFKSGEQPTRFQVGVIPPSDLTRILDEHARQSEGACWGAFLASVRGIENGPGQAATHQVNGTTYVKPEWLRNTFVRGLREVAVEVGRVSLFWNSVTDTDAKNS
jgi:hypothetical protein